ncbi:hypothetical protein Ais01nite_83710 [Asanoa ishikariensis]|uniref:Lipoprotein n=1 Tax=Asanoa ishikariensis TaxID=137265 RepID=A0A1H3S858_9ACTN|nr:hypothetical protein [Asanoa ishikariensis]GIF70336.1 hypothetical protein Ais01nite_83710 [Asanoa ishikariensis]SDZ33910.1 hypothetical protein SAMN05421684_4665 [Asanoa ishikariensis]
MTKSTPRTALLAAAVLLAAALTGCGGAPGADNGTEVATLTTPDVKVSASDAATDGGRPQLRLDSTDEEENALWQAYNVCLFEHGVKKNEGRSAGAVGDGGGLSLDQSGEPKAAYVACENKLPLQPPELDRDKNPNYVSQWNDYVQCLRKRGANIHSLPDGSGWTYDDDVNTAGPGLDEDEMAKAEKSCTMEIFGGKK